MPEAIVQPDFKIVYLDQTSNWLESIRDQLKGGRIWAVYLFDKNQITHCCELTPSYALHFIRDEGEMGDGTDIDEKLQDEIQGADNCTDVDYFHCRIIDLLPEDRFADVSHNEDYDPAKHDNKEEWYKDELEHALDYARCNS